VADERIDIEITDKVDPNVEKNILGIAKASDKGFSSVQKLKAALKDVNVSGVAKLNAASAAVTNSLAREMNATAKLTVARSRAAEIDARAALAAGKLATEQAKAAAATMKAEAAASRAAAAKDREANASKRLSAELAREASASQRVIHDRNTVQPAAPGALGGTAGSRSEAASATNSMRRNSSPIPADTPKVLNDAATGADKLTNSLGKAGAASGLARHQMVNLGYQLQDIVVSLQAGQNPLTVFIQQGSQIGGIAASAGIGLGGMTKAVWALIAPFAPLVIALGAAYLGFKSFTNDMATKHDAELNKYANSLGLTQKEMRKLGNESVDANGKLKKFDTVTITMADSWNGFVATVKEGLSGITAPFEGVTGYFKSAWDATTSFLRYAFIGFYGLVVGGMTGIARVIMRLPTVAGETAKAIANGVIAAVEFMLNKAIDGLNALTSWAAPVLAKFGITLGQIGKVGFGRFERSGSSAMGIIADSAVEAMHEADATLKGFAKRWDANTLKAAKGRIKNAADAIIANRNPKAPKKEPVDKTAENRARALAVINLKLDDELARMKMLKPEREIQQRFDQIEADLLAKKIKLNDAEKTSIMGKIRAIEAYKFVQAESDRIYEESVGPLRTYNAVITASKDLLAQQAISADQASQSVLKAKRAYQEATDPLFAMNEALDTQITASKLYGQAVDQNNYKEQVRQAFLAKGIDLLTNATAAQQAEAAAIVAKNNALLQQQYIQAQIGEVVNPLLADQQMLDAKTQMYAEIERLRQADVLSERQAQQARYGLDAKFAELRIKSASTMFGALASLSSNGNKKLAAIGKAAAVAQATMDGYVAVQKALASAPPPFNIIAAGAVAVATGAQVAGILSTNVGSFATGGQFMVDGRSGVDANNINMNVTRGERVTIETPAQQRANDQGGNGGGSGDTNLKVVNVTDPKDILAAMNTAEGERVVFNIIRRNPKLAKQLMGAAG